MTLHKTVLVVFISQPLVSSFSSQTSTFLSLCLLVSQNQDQVDVCGAMHVVILLLYNYSFSWLACGEGLVNCLCVCCARARPRVCVCVHSQDTDGFGSTLRLAFYLAILTSLASLPRVNLAIISAVIFWRCVRSMPGVSECVCVEDSVPC